MLKKLSFCSQVERIQNPSLYQQYMIKKKDVEQQLTSPQPVERELFHGTSEEDAKKICAHGFDRGFAGKNGKFNIIVKCLTLVKVNVIEFRR